MMNFINSLSLKQKVVGSMLAAGIIPLMVTVSISYYISQSSLTEQITNQLKSLEASKRQQIELYFKQINDQIVSLAEDKMIVDAIQQFNSGFKNLPGALTASDELMETARQEVGRYYSSEFGRDLSAKTDKNVDVRSLVPSDESGLLAQYLYIAKNPNPLGSKDNLDADSQPIAYNQVHDKYHPILRNFLKRFGYYDIFLVDAKTGHIVYSVFKELDYGTSLLTGPYKDTNFARSFKQALNSNGNISANLVDFEPYLPSYNAPASFISAPIVNKGKVIGVLVFQMPVDRINTIMQQASGLGETGETYLVGSDKLMRSQSRLTKENTILERKVDNQATEHIFSGKGGIDSFELSNGEAALVAYAPLKIAGFDWGIIAEITEGEVLAPITMLRNINMIVSIVSLFLIGFLALILARTVRRQLGADPSELSSIAESIAAGDLDVNDGISTTEAKGVLASLVQMRQNLFERNEAEKASAMEVSRIKQAMDALHTEVMLADDQYNIIYANDSAKRLFKAIESDIRQLEPSFNANDLIGTNMGKFRKGRLESSDIVDQSNTSLFKFENTTLVSTLTPIRDSNNKTQGFVIDWTNRSQEVAIEREVESLVTNAKLGDLSQRISLDNKEGFFANISSGTNDLVDIIERVINDTVRVLSAMAQGDLSETIQADYEGTFGQLKHDANATVAKLTDIIGQIKTGADEINTGAGEISQGNLNLSQRTEEQASSLEETASSMEEMTSTVKQNADNAAQANQLTSGTRQQAEQGGIVVNKAISAMTEINSSSKKIADIIGVIDEIAFQTNLLALNAAVEAARAGEQGRGFAVVASEVRNLAQRSATAAKEIKELIQDSVVKVEDGSKLVNQSGQTLDEIINSVKKVSDIVAEIAAASQEQASGIEQVNQAITQMDEMTQQNAALVEQAAAASESMSEQAQQMNGLMSFFQIGKMVQSPARPMAVQHVAERRSEERPWAATNSSAAQSKPAPAMPKAQQSGGGSADEWEEF